MGSDESTDALLARATSLIELGRSREALPYVWRARAADPENGRACCLEACIYLNGQEFRRAAVAARMALSKAPQEGWAHQLLATSLHRLGDHRGATASADAALRIAPDDPQALRVAHRCYLGAGKKREARTLATRLLRLAPEWPDTHVVFGEMAAAESKWSDAEPYFRRALQLDAVNTYALNWLGHVLERQGKRREAVECFHRSARLDPSGDWIRSTLVRVIGDYSGLISLTGLLAGVIWVLVSDSRKWSPGTAVLAWLGALALLLGAVWWHRRQIASLHPEVARFFQEELRRGCDPFFRLPLLLKLPYVGLVFTLLCMGYRSMTEHQTDLIGWQAYVGALSLAGSILAAWWTDRDRQRFGSRK